MKAATQIHLNHVQEVYAGPERELWELLMGEQIHIGGFHSSMDLSSRARITPGMTGVDFCCCTGAGMRFLSRFRQTGLMTGVDATPRMVELGRERLATEISDGRARFILADVCQSGLDGESADFIWGEDAWCYVENKSQLIAEAARIVKPGGVIAFTDWMEGPVSLTEAEAERFLAFMKFPSLAAMDDYSQMLNENGCSVLCAEDTGRFAPAVDLYLSMLAHQLMYDALKIVGFDQEMLQAVGREMQFVQELARAGKLIQGIVIARKG